MWTGMANILFTVDWLLCMCVLSVPSVGSQPLVKRSPAQLGSWYLGRTHCVPFFLGACVCVYLCVFVHKKLWIAAGLGLGLVREPERLGIQDQLQQRLPKTTYWRRRRMITRPYACFPFDWALCVLGIEEAQPCYWVDLGTQSSSSSLTFVKPPLQQLWALGLFSNSLITWILE